MPFPFHVDSEARPLLGRGFSTAFFPPLPFSFPPVFLVSPAGAAAEVRASLPEVALPDAEPVEPASAVPRAGDSPQAEASQAGAEDDSLAGARDGSRVASLPVEPMAGPWRDSVAWE
jgi:hypothetical protein